MNPNSKKFNRNKAFSMEIANPNSEKADPINQAIELCGDLVTFHENSISEIIPASKIDPDNKEPDTRHSYQHRYQIGSNNPYIARTILQAKSILDSVKLRKGLEKTNIIDHIWECTKHLISCEEAYYGIYNETMKKMHECDRIITEAKNSSHIPSLPQVEDLEQRGVVFLGNGKRFLEKVHNLLSVFYHSPNLESNFQAYREWAMKHLSTKKCLIGLLEENKDWIKMLAWYRNALDINHLEPDFKVKINNFKLHPGNKFSNPSWQYDFSREKDGTAQDNPSDIITDMDTFLKNMLTFFEALYLTCIKDNWDTNFNFEIYRHKEENIRKECPVLFFVGLNKNIKDQGKNK